MKRITAATFIFLLLISCSSGISSVSYEPIERQPKPNDYPIEILDRANLDRPFKVIGYIEVVAWRDADLRKTFRRLKAEARKLGGNALIDIQKERRTTLQFIWSAKVIIWS